MDPKPITSVEKRFASETSSVTFGLSTFIDEASTAINSAFRIFLSRLKPRKSVAPDVLVPLRLTPISVNPTNFDFKPNLASDTMFASCLGSKATRRHTIAIYSSVKKSQTEGLPEPTNRHARSATAPLTISLTSDEFIMLKENRDEKRK